MVTIKMFVAPYAEWLRQDLDLEHRLIRLVSKVRKGRIEQVRIYGLQLPSVHKKKRTSASDVDAIFCSTQSQKFPDGWWDILSKAVEVKFRMPIGAVNIRPILLMDDPSYHSLQKGIPLTDYLTGKLPEAWYEVEPPVHEFLVFENVQVEYLAE